MRVTVSLTLVACLIVWVLPVTAQGQLERPESIDLRGSASQAVADPLARAGTRTREPVRLSSSGEPTPSSDAAVQQDDKPAAESKHGAANSWSSVVEVSVGVALVNTSCYELQGGGPICRGSLVAGVETNCYLQSGCKEAFLGTVVSMARNLNDWFAVAGEVGLYGSVELTPGDQARSVMVGPKFKKWRFFGQILAGAESHEIFPSSLVIQPGVGIDLSASRRTRVEIDYSYLPGNRDLSGPRILVGAVWHFGTRTRP
jgi:hypothetical protein